MPIPRYLAMTAAEMAGCTALPRQVAWMACHFSSSGKGLSNLPRWLPADSLLILDDSIPMQGHDLQQIAVELGACLERLQCVSLLLDFQRAGEEQTRKLVEHLQCVGLLLDFQRAGEEQTRKLAEYLYESLPFPIVVSDTYAEGLNCGVFVSPTPPDEAMASRLSPWKGREIWLDTTMEGLEILLTEEGATSTPLPPWERPEGSFEEKRLHCHYRISLEENSAAFTFWRTKADIEAQLAEAEALGVTAAVGLFQEFGSPLPESEEG